MPRFWDFALRVLVSSIVSAIVSGGILYFAFDQSLRGVETAVTVVSESVSQNGAWIRNNGNKLDALGTRLEDKLDDIAASLTLNREDNVATYVSLVQQQRSLNGTIANSMTTTLDLFNALLEANELPEDRKAEIERLLSRLEGQKGEIEGLNSVYDAFFPFPR